MDKRRMEAVRADINRKAMADIEAYFKDNSGTHTLGEIADATGLAPTLIIRAAYLLGKKGVLAYRGERYDYDDVDLQRERTGMRWTSVWTEKDSNDCLDEFIFSFFTEDEAFSRSAQDFEWLCDCADGGAKLDEITDSLERLVAAGKIYKIGDLYGNKTWLKM